MKSKRGKHEQRLTSKDRCYRVWVSSPDASPEDIMALAGVDDVQLSTVRKWCSWWRRAQAGESVIYGGRDMAAPPRYSRGWRPEAPYPDDTTQIAKPDGKATKRELGAQSKPRNVVLFVRGVPEELRREFKARCAHRGISMNQRLIELMRDDVGAERGSISTVTDPEIGEVERIRRVRDEISSRFATFDEYFAWLRKLDREYRQRKKRNAARRKVRSAKRNGR